VQGFRILHLLKWASVRSCCVEEMAKRKVCVDIVSDIV